MAGTTPWLTHPQRDVVTAMRQGWTLWHWLVLDDYRLHFGRGHAPQHVDHMTVKALLYKKVIRLATRPSAIHRHRYELTEVASDAS